MSIVFSIQKGIKKTKIKEKKKIRKEKTNKLKRGASEPTTHYKPVEKAVTKFRHIVPSSFLF